ncbi:Sister chromatid cohesion 1 protein 3 [Camellia lanceoleosa]|uniref:Sister chromatid cohesion 1 protein 3 n=1 Tax=Camellia lanceoleosa TaxID=1840588 RepID=A0ACC0ILD1_9ERIC|nr:Sister chromatid cohesion 1 protein 3 [Camellia lanceoleosa]
MFHLGMHHLNWQCVQCHLLASQKLRKEKIFLEPLMTGLCADLCNVYTRDFIAAKPHLVNVEEACPEPIVAESPPMHGLEMEIERLQNY